MRSLLAISLLAYASASHLMEDDVVQLQVRGSPQADDGEADVADDDGCGDLKVGHTPTIPNPDFIGDPVKVPRKCVSKYPQQFYASIPMTENGIKFFVQQLAGIGEEGQSCEGCGGSPEVVPCTCVPYVRFPLDHHYSNLVGSRTTEHSKSSESGELRWLADEAGDPERQLVPGTKIGIAERFHVLEHEGEWEEAVGVAKPTNYTEPASWQTEMRTKLAMAYNSESAYGALLGGVSFDKGMQQELGLAIHQKKTIEPTEQEFKRIVKHITGVKAELGKLPDGQKPSSISTSCTHILDHPLLKVVGDEHRFAMIPLNVYLGTVRGQTVFYPAYQMSFSMGRGFFTMVGDNLIFHQGASALGEYNVAREGFGQGKGVVARAKLVDPMVYVSAPTGDKKPADFVKMKDTRYESQAVRKFHHDFNEDKTQIFKTQHLFQSYAQIPMSYTYLYRPLATTCPASEYAELQAAANKVTYSAMENGEVTPTDFVDHYWNAISCGSGFLRGSEDQSNGLDMFELAVWGHFLMEWPEKNRLHAVRGSEIAENGWHWKHMETEPSLS